MIYLEDLNSINLRSLERKGEQHEVHNTYSLYNYEMILSIHLPSKDFIMLRCCYQSLATSFEGGEGILCSFAASHESPRVETEL